MERSRAESREPEKNVIRGCLARRVGKLKGQRRSFKANSQGVQTVHRDGTWATPLGKENDQTSRPGLDPASHRRKPRAEQY